MNHKKELLRGLWVSPKSKDQPCLSRDLAQKSPFMDDVTREESSNSSDTQTVG